MSKFRDIINSNTPTLVDFHATWCGPCQKMQPILEQFKIKTGNSIRVVKIDVDKNQEITSKFKIRSVPTLILFKKGEIVWKHAGFIDLNTLLKKVK